MDDVEYAKLNHKKRRGKPQQTKPYLEDPTTIVYADIKTSHIQLPVEDPKLDVTENTGRSAKCGNIIKILTVFIILALSCALAVLIYKLNQGTAKEHQCPLNSNAKNSDPKMITEKTVNTLNSNTTNSANCDAEVRREIKKHLCVNNSAGCRLCPGGWLLRRENCYYFSSGGDQRTWNESREVCKEMGAHLLVIEDRGQQV
ncbi:killer cell lectin-like receptor subfamily B member 1B allele B [Aquarana catesbeiana]|uniref:killer cell lectin-like receptor subfamily B member 1B allele B n=1 Tax=Aquarana catesbeiana TaxID=8400 RepID=UPI003CC92AD4